MPSQARDALRNGAAPLRTVRDRMLDAVGGEAADAPAVDDTDLVPEYLPDEESRKGD